MARFIIQDTPIVKNEDSVIHVAKRWLEFVAGAKSENEVKPDSIERKKPEVDRTFYIKKQKYALEHTCIEAFPEEFKNDGVWNSHLGSKMKELENELNSSLSLSHDMTLFFPIFPNNVKMSKKNVGNIFEEVKTWIIARADKLGEHFPENIDLKPCKIKTYSFELRLSQSPVRLFGNATKGRFGCMRIVLSDEAHDRRIIVEKAFRSKANKLSAHKEKGAKSVLVLEWRYRIPTPYSPIIYAHRILKETYQNAIDMVILVGLDNKEWAIKYTEPDLKISEKELMHNWWLYNWEEDKIRKHI